MAAQTARLINVQCGTEAAPSPATPDMCMSFSWDSTDEKITTDENPEATMRAEQERIKSIMRSHVGGKNV